MREDAFDPFPARKGRAPKNFLKGVLYKNRLEIKKVFGFSIM